MSYAESLDSFAGPITLVAIEFPSGAPDDVGFAALAQGVRAGHIALLDIELLQKHDGVVYRAELATLIDDAHPQLAAIAPYATDILDDEDFAEIADEVGEGSSVIVVLYEDRTLVPAFDAWAKQGARLAVLGAADPNELIDHLND